MVGRANNVKSPYVPKPIRGQRVKGYTKVSVAQVKRLFTDGQTFSGFIVGNKVASYHFFNGWGLACRIQSNTLADFTTSLNSFHFYLDSELGTRAAIYLKKPSRVSVVPAMPPLLIG